MTMRHPNLLSLYGYGIWENLPYLITPYRTEGSLATTLQQGAYTPARTLRVLEPIAAGLEYAHRSGLVHGILTPAHLLLSREQPIQIAGLGLLSLLERRGILPIADSNDYRLTVAGTSLAAPKYLAAEYLQGQAANIRSDIYSLGVILFELLRGALLPQEANPLDVLLREDDTLPRSLQNVLSCALAQDPNERFRRASDLLVAFAKEVEQEEVKYASQRRSQSFTPTETSSEKSETIVWQRSPSRQLSSVSQPSPRRPSSDTGRFATRLRLPGAIGRRKVTALLTGSVAGVAGVSVIINLKGLLNSPTSAVPSAPTHTGTVISNTKQAPNTALNFNNPGDTEKRQSALIRLPNGTFVAYKRGCTHVGVLVNYDSKTKMLACPAHGAIFDPAQGGRVVTGPATKPLPSISIHINNDGTITV
jgi:serine/threonine protein kinase